MSRSISIQAIVLGTRNVKKGRELAELLAPLGIPLKTLADFPKSIEVVEDGDSFAANAQRKASGYAQQIGQWVVGEDSGLAVDALDGQPGIYSARYSGPDATDLANNERLLDALGNTPLEARTAYYVCHATLSDPSGTCYAESEGICRGRITRSPAGSAGFGYDPLFEIPEYHQTFGQLGEVVKSVLSHRARALRLLVPQIARLVGSDRADTRIASL